MELQPASLRLSTKLPKYDLSKILTATAGLKEADMKLFESMLAALHAMSKSTRSRILAAVGKVFA